MTGTENTEARNLQAVEPVRSGNYSGGATRWLQYWV